MVKLKDFYIYVYSLLSLIINLFLIGLSVFFAIYSSFLLNQFHEAIIPMMLLYFLAFILFISTCFSIKHINDCHNALKEPYKIVKAQISGIKQTMLTKTEGSTYPLYPYLFGSGYNFFFRTNLFSREPETTEVQILQTSNRCFLLRKK